MSKPDGGYYRIPVRKRESGTPVISGMKWQALAMIQGGTIKASGLPEQGRRLPA